jgi:outer membrane autotransporter protein
MKIHSLPRPLFLAIAITAACGTLTRTHAATNIWTDGFGVMAGGAPYWVNFKGAENNWSLGAVPVATDDVVFQLPYVPPNSTFQTGTPPFQPLADGRTIVLFPGSSYPPPLVANSLTFSGNYTLVTAAAVFNSFPAQPGVPFQVEALTLTSGRISVTDGFQATIDVPLVSLTGTVTKSGVGTLRLNDVLGFQAVNGNLVVDQGRVGGNFTVTGNFNVGKSGGLALQIASPTSFDQIRVDGHAKVQGALDVTLLNGFKPHQGEKFVVVTAANGVSGKIDNVDAPVFDLLTLRPFYTHNTVTLKVVVNSFEALPGLTSNQGAVGRALDGVISDSREAKLLDYLYGQRLNQLPADYDKLAPEELTSIFAISTALSTVQSQNIQRRTDDIRSGSSGFSAAGLAINGNGPSYSGGFGMTTGPNGDDGKDTKEMKTVAPVENRWGAFLSGTGEWVNVSGTDNARGYDLASGGFTLGIDYKVCPNFAIGLMAGYTGTTADLTDHGRVWVNGGKIGIYATTFVGGWYADAAVDGGYNSYDTRRSGIQGEARGDTNGGELGVLFGTGYDFKAGALTFGPTASFNYTYTGTNGFTENGSLAPLNIHGGDAQSLRSAFGFKASYDCKVGSVVIKPEIRAAWQHEYGDTAYSLDSSFANGGGGNFSVDGPKLGRDSLLLGAGFAIQCSERCSTYFYYDGEVGRTNYQSNAVTGGVRVSF